MSGQVSERCEAFIEALCELDLDPQLLREDPGGERWLPRSLRRMAQEDPACARELAEFVEMELALFEVHEPNDAFFTRLVMDRLPELEAVDDRRRTWILASAYALAIGMTYLLLGPLLRSGEFAGWVEPLHDWYHGLPLEAGGMWMVLALVLAAGALVLIPSGGRRRADA
ncbi:hypothetical protein ENSA5_54280 [Enhygromyxa salina]|uniref:Uncharacterized protein n=1 Tax=Enhygromyxa salina TaxID=215803 RepID=A0A2S9XFB6_9BACT|nr:hypothetical protein [Enhygromyxa salina]PRP91552.1 hypothetical protein ENSA5_54280 [Enhygromyxa salina]